MRALIKRMYDSSPDDFYEKTYEGWYCVGCELFKRDDEIVDGKCVLHPTRDLQWTQERNWFFRLTKYQPFLERLLAERPEFIQPESRRNEILGLLAQGLEDISITRSKLAWAIPFPVASANGEQQGTWVWFDALPNYLTATGYPDKRWRDRWPAQLHVIGKDITRLHCVIWPAMLQSAELPLPERVWAHGFISFGGERFSKSAGVKIDLDETDRALRPRRLPLFPAPRDSVRRRRDLLARALRRGVHVGAGERTRQPREPRHRDGREVLRRRRPGLERPHRAGRARLRGPRRRPRPPWTGRAAISATRRSRASRG